MRRGLVGTLCAVFLPLAIGLSPSPTLADDGGWTSTVPLADGQKSTGHVPWRGGGVGGELPTTPASETSPPPATRNTCGPPSPWTLATVALMARAHPETTIMQPLGPPDACILHTLNLANVQNGTQWAVEQQASVEQHLAGGIVRVHPQPDRQFVNVPSQVYLEGAGINGQPNAYLRQTLDLDGYNFSFITKLVEVDWTWGDGTGDQLRGSDGLGQDVYPPNGVSTAQHRYDRIGQYQVQAVERWAVAATMTDPAGRVTTITAATREFQRSAQASFTVLQIEGVPGRPPG